VGAQPVVPSALETAKRIGNGAESVLSRWCQAHWKRGSRGMQHRGSVTDGDSDSSASMGAAERLPALARAGMDLKRIGSDGEGNCASR
jgi:hypothetical protein